MHCIFVRVVFSCLAQFSKWKTRDPPSYYEVRYNVLISKSFLLAAAAAPSTDPSQT